MATLLRSTGVCVLFFGLAATACGGHLLHEASGDDTADGDAAAPSLFGVVHNDRDGDGAPASTLASLVLSPPTGTVRSAGTLKIVALGSNRATFRLTTNNSGGSIDANTGVYTAGSLANKVDTVTVTDADGATGTVQIEVSPVVALSPSTANAPPGGAIIFQGSGGSGAGFVARLLANHSGATLDASTGRYTAGATANVQDVVELVDSAGNTATAFVNVGGALSVSPESPAVAPRGGQTFTAPSGATFVLATNLSGSTIDAADGTYKAGPFPSVEDVVLVTDGHGHSVSRRIAVGAGVSLSPSPVSVVPGGAKNFTAAGGSGAGFDFTFVTNNSGATIDPSTGAYVAGASPGVTDTVKVVDSLGNSATQTITVGTALGLTSTPNAAPPPNGLVTFSGSGGFAPYLFSLATNLSGATIDANTGVYHAGAIGSAADEVQITDSLGNTALVPVTVGPPVTLTPATIVLPAGGTQLFGASGGSNGSFAFSVVTNNSGATIDPSTGLYTAGATTGVDTIQVLDLLENVATTTISVTAAPTVSGVSPSSGVAAGGTIVTLTGAHFTGATAVSFGGAMATDVVVVSDTQLSATAPAHAAGLVDVHVLTAGGTSASSVVDHYTYASPKPTVTGVSPAFGPRTGGTAITITGTNFTNATYVRWTGAPGGQGTQASTTTFTIVSDTEIQLTTPANVFGPLLDDVHVGSAAGESVYNASDEYQWQ